MPRLLTKNIIKHVERMYNEGQVKDTVCKHRLSLNPDGIIDKTESGKIKTPWSDVQQIVLTQQYLYIYISDTMAHIVPRNTFADDAQCDDFIATVKRYCERARD